VVAFGFLESQVIGPQFPANVLPIFLTDNVFESGDGTRNTCCVLGYHSSQGPPASTAATRIYAAYTEPGTFRNNVILDVLPLSHEVAEWLNDPFVGALAIGFVNLIPPALLPGQGGACIINFETGDPLEAPPAVFTQTIGGTTYHLQDEVFLPWYLHTTPSFSVNSQYSFQNTFTTPSSLCGSGINAENKSPVRMKPSEIRRLFFVRRACSTARECKSPLQPDGGKVVAKRKGVVQETDQRHTVPGERANDREAPILERDGANWYCGGRVGHHCWRNWWLFLG